MASNLGIRDRVSFFSDAISLLEPIITGITNMQDAPAEHQILAPAAVLVCLCDSVGIDPHIVVNQIQRARSQMNSPFHNEWRAMVAYGEGELK